MKARRNSAAVKPATVPRILVVEDDECQREILSEFFANEGFSVESTGDGYEAISRITAEPPDLVILDAVLPDCDGLRVLSTIPRPMPPVFVITGYDHVKGMAVYEGGAVTIFRKPLNLDDMLAAAKHHTQPRLPIRRADDPHLTEREREALELIAQGYSTLQVAALMKISVHTVFVYRKTIKRKFQGQSFIEICRLFKK